ncbi:hypothetical protein BDN70DRAFT_998047 [Pholiota conissans]|uniref:ABM domain-containing protein n=1 Tax=Pholiota conissans TaxID=109636 RepID=A0A9P5YPI6_9AGAR|nr:hypothetical protein BDN70DRAFT_998047 [Pholiota conissans]
MPVHEIILFAASEAFADDPVDTLKNSREFFSKVDGCYSIHGGVSEEVKNGLVVISWESYEHHQAIKKLEGFPQILGLAPIFGQGDPTKVYHVNFAESPDAAIAMNVTEVLTLTLKDGKTKEDLSEPMAVLASKLTVGDRCAKPLAWGETREAPGRVFFLFLGWETSQKLFEAISQRSYEDFLCDLSAIVDIRMLRVSFKKVF